MAKVLKLEELIAAALASGLPTAAKHMARLEAVATDLAHDMADLHGITSEPALWDDGRGAVCAVFGPGETEICPLPIAEFDPCGAWTA